MAMWKNFAFSTINSIDDLRFFLELKGGRHRPYYQYTTIDVLQGMLTNKRLFLTRMDQLNDAMECKNELNKKRRTYIASFSFGHAENMAMWSMYGTPYKRGIRLSILQRAITKTLNAFKANPVIYSTETEQAIFSSAKAKLKMMDVIYVHPGSLENKHGKILKSQGNIVEKKDDPDIAFCVKNEAWLYECESRMILELENELPKDVKKIAIDFKFSKDDLNVISSPCVSQSERETWAGELNILKKEQFQQSVAYDQVYFKNCRGCDKRTVFCIMNNKTIKHQIAYSAQTFIRHADNESLLWNRRTSACVILQDAKPFLDAVSYEPQSIDNIITKVASAFEAKTEDVADDVREFIQMLVDETFCETDEKTEKTEQKIFDEFSFNEKGEIQDSGWTPLGSFFEKHELPTELHIDLTNGCTERCIHCYIPDYTPHFLSLETVKKILNEFREAGGLTIHFSGGECMMHPDFAEILRYAKSLHLNILILSNLTLCDKQKVELLKEIDPQFVNVSLYSMEQAVHDSITTIKGSWQKTMGAILALEKAGVHVRLACPVMKNNYESLPDLLKFANEHHMHLIPDCDIFGQIDHDCSNQNCSMSPKQLEAILQKHGDILCGSFDGEPERMCPEHKVCDIGKTRIDVNAHGDYYPCDGCHGIVLGNAATHTFSEVWYGEKLNALRALCNKDFPECVNCANRKWCKVCPTRNFNETGDMFKHTPERCIAAAIKRKIFGE